jgi:hypothetical protein
VYVILTYNQAVFSPRLTRRRQTGRIRHMPAKYRKTIICLANSRKLAGRCVAAKEIAGSKIGAWIRPVSRRPTGELSETERRFLNGQDPKLLDVIAISMIEPQPHAFQTENHLIDDRYYWIKCGEAAWHDLKAALDPAAGPLWDNSSSGYNGLHDRVAEGEAHRLLSSLRLIEVRDLNIAVAVEGAEAANPLRKVRGRFTHYGVRYCLTVTDPIVEEKSLAGADGEFEIGYAILCISLGEPYKGHAYKLIAGVFLKPQ